MSIDFKLHEPISGSPMTMTIVYEPFIPSVHPLHVYHLGFNTCADCLHLCLHVYHAHRDAQATPLCTQHQVLVPSISGQIRLFGQGALG